MPVPTPCSLQDDPNAAPTPPQKKVSRKRGSQARVALRVGVHSLLQNGVGARHTLQSHSS